VVGDARLDRRALLLAGAAGALLGGCGAGEGRPGGRDHDRSLVTGLLRLERRAVAIYERQDGALAARLLAHEREHVARLEDALPGQRAAGRARAADDPGSLELARRLEETSVAAYLTALPRVGDPGLRRLLAGIAAVEAEHLAAVSAALGEPAAPAAFVRGRDAL
jgi:hypothetical protein